MPPGSPPPENTQPEQEMPMACNDNELDHTMMCLEYLMSRFVLKRKLWIARAVVDHLEKLQAHPRNPRRESHATLLSIWSAIAAQMEQPKAANSAANSAANDDTCLSQLLAGTAGTGITPQSA
jgi:hypothetical protein